VAAYYAKSLKMRSEGVSGIYFAVGRIRRRAFMNSFMKAGVPLNDYQLLWCQKRFIT
jgi:hypothetical protein